MTKLVVGLSVGYESMQIVSVVALPLSGSVDHWQLLPLLSPQRSVRVSRDSDVCHLNNLNAACSDLQLICPNRYTRYHPRSILVNFVPNHEPAYVSNIGTLVRVYILSFLGTTFCSRSQKKPVHFEKFCTLSWMAFWQNLAYGGSPGSLCDYSSHRNKLILTSRLLLLVDREITAGNVSPTLAASHLIQY